MSASWFRSLAEDAARRADGSEGFRPDPLRAAGNWGKHSAYKHAAELTEATAASLDSLAALHEPPANEAERGRGQAFREAARIVRGEPA